MYHEFLILALVTGLELLMYRVNVAVNVFDIFEGSYIKKW